MVYQGMVPLRVSWPHAMNHSAKSVVLLGGLLLLGAGCGGDTEETCSGTACGPAPPGAPTFAGVRAVAPDATGERLRVSWAPATDDRTPPEAIVYRVYVSSHAGQAARRPAVATSSPGASDLFVQIAPPGATYHVVVHAVDADGNEDRNGVEKSAVASADSVAPTFAGAKTAAPVDRGGVKLTWDPGTDDRTPPEGLRYVVHGEDGVLLATVENANEATPTSVGPPGALRRFLVRAVDAAGHLSSNSAYASSLLGADKAGPVFQGCAAAESLGSRVVRVTWPAATDDLTAAERITYDISLANGPGGAATRVLGTVTGATSLVLRDLAPATEHHFLCHARDEAGNTEPNQKTVSARTTDNVVPPTFAGGSATVDTLARSATLTWAAATDDRTPPAQIVYAVYAARGADPFDFTAPFLVTPPGATGATLTDLRSRTQYRFVVRARDADHNEDANVTATGGATGTSWKDDVLPLFAVNCAVVGCHVGSISAGGLSLSPYNAYESIVDVNAAQRPTSKRVVPSSSPDSYLWLKVANAPGIAGSPMPAAGTGNILSEEQKQMLKSWIDEGARRN